ncbi:MAG: HDOD domain-containing protein [Methylococcaceae bacterium]|nr:MAG: HDOD domain-containing protein [Methylococcaceae bacterium]
MPPKAPHIALPPQPDGVIEINKQLGLSVVDLKKIVAVIQKDPALTAKVLKVANSPLFCCGRSIDSVTRAVQVMGLNNFRTVVVNVALREVFSQGDSEVLEKFWKHSELAALSCDIIARQMVNRLAPQAYLHGLFHDCAIPIMANKYPDYAELIQKSLHYQENVIALEEERYFTNHCTLGYFFAKSWALPELVCAAIQQHHNESLADIEEEDVKLLVAISQVSEFIIQDFDSSGNMKTISIEIWAERHDNAMQILGIEPDHIRDFEEELLEKMNETIGSR